MPAGSNAILSDEELAVALAEVEQLSGPAAGKIPSLDEAATPVLVPVPNIQPPAAPAAAPSIAKPNATSAPPDAAAARTPPAKAEPLTAAAPPKPTAQAGAPNSQPQRTTLGQVLYRAADALLDWVNWPFARLSESTRSLIGSIGVVTLCITLASLAIAPLLQPDRDPLGFLRRRPPPVAAPGDAGHGAAPAADAHGGGH